MLDFGRDHPEYPKCRLCGELFTRPPADSTRRRLYCPPCAERHARAARKRIAMHLKLKNRAARLMSGFASLPPGTYGEDWRFEFIEDPATFPDGQRIEAQHVRPTTERPRNYRWTKPADLPANARLRAHRDIHGAISGYDSCAVRLGWSSAAEFIAAHRGPPPAPYGIRYFNPLRTFEPLTPEKLRRATDPANLAFYKKGP